MDLATNEINSLDLTTPTNYLGGVLLDTSKSLVFATYRSSSAEPSATHAFVSLDDEQTISFVRFTGTQVNAEWMIVEFSDGVDVTAGLTTFGDCTTSACRQKSITLPQSYDLSRSLAFVSWKSYSDTTATNKDEMHMYTVEFSAANKILIQRTDSTSAAFNDVYYQVVQFDEDVSVQSGTIQIAAASASAATGATYNTGTVAVTNGSKNITGTGTTWTAAMTGRMFEVGGTGKRYKFTRTANTTGTIEPAYEGATASGQSYNIRELLTVDTAKTIIFFTRRSGTAIAGDDGLSNCDVELTDANTLTFRRPEAGAANQEMNISWFALTFLDYGYTQKERVAAANPAAAANYDRTMVETEMTRTLATYSDSITSTTNSATYWDDLIFTMQETSNTNLRFIRNHNTGQAGQPFSVNLSWFSAEFPPVKVAYPDGGETLLVGGAYSEPGGTPTYTPYDLSFNYADESKGDACTIQIYLNSAWRDVNAWTCPAGANTGTYSWSVPPTVQSQNVIGTTAKIRLLNSSITVGTPDRNFDDSGATFEIKGQVHITAPVTTQSWAVGSTQTLSWSNKGDFTGLGTAGQGTVYYSTAGSSGPWTVAKKTDGVTDANDISLGADAGSGGTNNFSWKVPDIIGTNVYLKIQKNNDAATYAVTPLPITVTRSITLVNPGMGTGESYTAQTPWDIRWNYTGSTGWGTVTVSVSTDAAHNNWTALTTTEAVGGAASDSPPYSGKGDYTASIPTTAVGTTVKVRVCSTTDPTICSTSSNDFSVLAKITLDTPSASGITVKVDDPYLITWTLAGSGVTAVKLEYSTAGSSGPWTQIVASTSATNVDSTHGSYSWPAIPNAIGTARYVKVTDTTVTTINDVSDNGFEIKGQLTNLYPSASGIVLNYGATTTVTWVAHGTIGNVDVVLSTDGVTFPRPGNTLGTVNASAQSYDWAMGTTGIGSSYKIRVISTADSSVLIDSANNFSVKGTLAVTAPAGGAVWTIDGTTTGKTITWTKNPGTLGNVKVEYTPDNGTNWYTVNGGGNVSGTSLPWDPTTPGNGLPDSGVLIRVSLVSDPLVTNTMASSFKIRGKLVLNIPSASGLVWDVGTSQSITWTSTPLAQGLVELRYSVAGGPFTLINNTTNSSAQTFTWTIPDAISTNVVARVASLNAENESAVSDDSDNAFTIRPRYIVVSPNGSEEWRVGEARNLTWKHWGTVDKVKLYYSTAGSGGPWNLIASAVSDTGAADGSTNSSFDWSTVGGVADSISATNRIKVESNYDATASDYSDADYTVRGNVTMGALPSVLRVGGSQVVSFTKNGSLNAVNPNFKILYATDGTTFTDPANLIATVSGTSTTWNPIPDAARSDTAKLKVQWQGDTANVFSLSSQVAIKPSISVTSPAGATYHIGDAVPIQFTHTGRTSDTFRFRYSIDGGTNWTTIDTATNVTPNVTYTHATWNVPNDPGIVAGAGKFKIRVEMVGDEANVTGDSAGSSILGNLAPMTPTSTGVVWTAGDTNRQITWTPQGITAVKIEYATDGVTFNNTIIASTTGNNYTWPSIPGTAVGDTLKIRLTAADAGDSVTSVTSANAVTILPKLTITAPNGPGTLSVGDPLTINWTSSGAGNIKIEYSTNADQGSPTWSTLNGLTAVDSTLGTIATTVPDAISDHVKFRLSNVTGNTNLQVYSVNGTEMSIKGKLTLQSLTGTGLTYSLGDQPNVVWSVAGTIGNVKVEYFNGTAWSTITTTAPQAGPYALLLDSPNTTIATDLAKVRISAANGSSNTATSANAFMVKPLITVTSPAGNEAWVVDDTNHAITWTFKGTNVANVKIDYSTDSGSTYPNAIVASTANNGSYTWPTIPDNIQATKNMKVRVSTLPASDPWAVQTASNGLFQIVGQLAMKIPDDTTGVKWRIGSTNTITWTNVHGSVANVKLEYSTDSGTNWTTIIGSTASGIPGDHTYDWAIPGTFAIVKNNLRIRVSDAANGNVIDASTAQSSTLAKITVDHPLSGEVWVAENTHEIDWTTPQAGVPSTVKIEYNVGAGWLTIPETDGTVNDGIVTNSGAVNWTLPVTRTLSAQIRISDPNDANSIVTSNNFKIRGDFAVTSPNSGIESWDVASTHAVTWTKKGDVATVKLQFSNDGGANYAALVDGLGADTQNINVSGAGPYTFNWKIPDIAGQTTTQARVRVVDASDSTVYDSSNNNFTVKGQVALTQPNGGETLGVGNVYSVTGTVQGVGITSVRLYYSINGGATYDYGLNEVSGGQVVSVSSGSFSQNWSVPDRIGSNLKVRVEDSTNSLVSDESNAAFSIKGTVAITSPTALSVWTAGSQQNIVWNRNGAVGNVDLYYQVNNGTWNTIATSVASPSATGNSYAWTLPNTGIVSTNVKVKIDSANLLTPEISPAFTVKGSISLTYPDASGIVLNLGDPLTITWSQTGSIGNVKVEYNDGSGWTTLTTTAPEAGPYVFTLDAPDTTVATSTAKIRVSQANDASVTDTSANDFMVKPFIQITSPAGNEAWVVGSSHNITWNLKGSNVATVKIEYSKNSGSTYNDVILASTPNDGSQAWTIPDDIQAVKNMKVRISTLPTSDLYAVQAVSSGLFQIIGALTMVIPDDTTGIQWRVNTSGNEIKWNATGSIANVKIEYSNNSGSAWSTLVASTPSGAGSNKSYAWTIPANQTIVKDNFRIRVLDAANTNVLNASAASSSILANFAVLHPLSGEIWVAENTHEIDWSTPTVGVPSNIKIEYNVGAGWLTIPESDGTVNDGIVGNSGSVNWTLPVTRTVSAQIRLSDPNDANSIVASNNFKIRGDLTMTAPNTGAESWEVATAHNITWTKKGDVSAVKLQWSNDGGSNYTALVDGLGANTQNVNVSGAGPYSFSWTVPDIAGITTTQGRIRVVDASDSTVYDSSDNNFTVKGRVTLTTPNGGETLGVGNTYAVTGTVNGVGITSVRLLYSTNGGTTYDYGLNEVSGGQVVSVTGGTFSQNWSVPDRLGANLKVRVEDATNSLVADESDAAFSIKGTVAITSPTNLSVWAAGSQQNIVWDRNGTVGNVDLFYQVNNGTWNTIATSVSSPTVTGNTYAWNLPGSGIVSTNVKVKIDGANLLNPTITSAFTVKGAISLTYPDASGIVLTLGDPLTITWSQTGSIGNVKVEYNDGSGWSTLTTAAPEAGPYVFTLDAPDTTIATSTAKIRVSQANDATVTDASTNDFMVKPYLAVTSPSGNESWVVGSSHNITWNFKGSNVANVKIEYSKNSGATYNDVIFASTPNDGSQAWTIPDDIQAVKNMKVRISTLPTSDLYAVQAVSSGLFQIVGALTMVIPDDTTPVAWRINTSGNEIKWNATGSIANVKIEYSNNAGSSWSTLVASTPSGAGSNKSYSWAIPSSQTIVKDNFRIRVLDAANTNVLDVADAASSILANFAIDHPVSGEVWAAETAYDIEWNTPQAGTPANVKLEYDLGGGYQTITASTANSGIYNWTLPAGLSTAARVRISDATDASSAVVSDPFKIRGTLTLTAPTGGEAWTYNTHHNVTWTKLGNMTAVKLEYTTNGSVYTLIATGLNPATGTPYDWTVPDVMSSTVQLKVTDTSDSTVYSQSGNFTVQGSLTLTAPNGSEAWVVGTAQNITWTKTGSIANVKLEYSVNAGGSYPNLIVASTPAGAAYPWTIPDVIGSQLRVRVTDAANAGVSDTSDGNFSVKGALTLTAPNGGEILSVGSSTNITWTRAGSIANVKLDYSTDGGSTYPNVITNVTGAPAGTYAWTVPDALGLTIKVRVSDQTDSTVFDVSNGNFTIRGALTITTPNGSEVWKVGQQQDILWQRFGSIANVKLEFSTNGGSTYPNTIIASTPAATGSYTWTLPDALTIQAKVRVTDVNDSGVVDTSDTNFSIKGQLTVTAPNGGESWGVGTNQNITWIRQGSIATVKIEYSTDGGATFPVEITSSTDASTGSFSWAIPDDLSITARVKVTQTNDGTVFDTTNANFKIVGALFLTAPDTGEGWPIGSSQNITWTRTGSIQNVKLELSMNGGSSFPTQITASTPAGGLSYNWTVPDSPSTTARVRISDANDATVNDVSAVNFKIQGTFDITSPNLGTEVWDVNSSHNITWTKVGSVANVLLEYSTDGGSNYGNTIAASTGNTGTFSWTIPDAISSAVRVRVSDVNDYSAFDVSNANLKIRGVLTLTSPNGGENWDVNSAHNITWTRTGSITNVKLEYSSDGGSNYTGLIIASTPANALSYAWTIPDIISTQVRVKMTDTSDPSVNDASNSNFTIKGALTLTAPNGGEQWIVNSGQNVTWNRFGSIANVQLEYSIDGGTSYPNVIIASTSASALSYTWTVPDDISTTVRVKVTDTSNAQVFDESNANFAIRGSFTVLAPNGGETWIVGSSHNITWTRQGTIPNAKLEYSTNGGSTFPNVIVGATDAAAGTYAWTVPDAIGSQVRVKVTDVNNSAVFDTSNADFIIKGSLALTAPNGTETWIVGVSNNITWNRSGTISTVKLEYSTDGGSTYPNTIVASTSGLTGTYAWTVADAISSQVRVRVSDTSDPTVVDASDANFTIKGSITVTAPNGGEAWVVNSVQNVTWTKTGTFATVKIEYSIDSGATYPNTIVGSTAAPAGTYAWTIPDDIRSAVRVRVTNNADTSVADASNTNFKITGAFTLTAPNGAEQWKVGQNNNITWTKVGSIVNAKLEYSTDGGSTYPNTINASTAAGALSYTWNVPDSLTTTAKVRISDASDATVFDVSNANFQIQASFAITAPNGGEVWVVNSAQDITWTKVGSASNVKLEYSTDGGTTYPNQITASTANSGTFSWTVPDAIGSTVKVRVSDATNAASFDVSDASFKIRGSLTLSSPNGSESWNVNTPQNITWSKIGAIANIKLEYSTDGGATYPNLINGTVDATLGTYPWTVPDSISANVRVKATDASDSTVYDESNANFRIRGTFTLVQPNGSEVLDVASAYQIQWTKVGSIADAKLEYSTDGGGTYPNVIVGSLDPATLHFDWTIPDSISTLVRVRIMDNNDTAVFDTSNANFKIRGVLALTAPNGSEVWDVLSVHNITWTKQGSITTAKLEYSTNGGSTYPNVIINSVGANLLTYAWTVPDSISTQVRVRITNLSDATVTDSSDANFKIQGVLTLTAPNGGEVWSVGDSQAIAWTRVGSIANAKLEYSSDGGVNYGNVMIASTPAANLSYGWTVPDVISSTMRVKISDVTDSTVADTSNANFKIRGALTITSPNGTEAFVIGSSRVVTWTKFGSISNAKLEYSMNGGTTFPNVIIGSVPANQLTYTWTVPDSATTQARVRISQVGDATVFDDSDANFTIRAGFTVTAPVGGEQWAVGSSHDITWITGGTISNIKLEYSSNGGNSYTTIIGSTPNNQTYPWVVPDAITTQARVRVSDTNDAQAADISPANFKIMGTLTITVPNGGEQWLVGSAHNITWTKAGSIPNVKLEYSTNGGSTYPNLINGSTSASGLSYSWTIPDAIGPNLKVRITDTNDATVTDTSDNAFRIKAAFTVTSPNGNENWVVGTAQNITWGTLGTVANVKLEYATDGGTAYNTITASTPAGAGTYPWTVPDAITTQARVRVSDVNDSSANDASDNNFKIRGSLTITAPNGAEKWNVGTNRLITWDRTGSIPNIKLEYSSNNGTVYTPIVASTTNTGSYSWTIPDAISTQALVRITDLGDNTVTDVSNATFKIMGNFTVTSPNGGETWTVTSSQNITWTSSGTMNFAKIEYSMNGGSTYPNLIVASTNNSGLYAWTVPDAISGAMKVKISDPNDPDAFDESNGNFRVRMTFTLTSPNGGQKWTVGNTNNITWTAQGTIPNVKLQYSRDNFLADVVTITAATPSTGAYSWTVPDAISNTVRVRVSDPSDIGAFDDSNADFKIMGGFTITAPNGGEKWDVNSTQTIAWAPTGTVPDAKLEYSVDGGATYPYVIAATPNNGTYSWLVPDTITAAFKVRISDLGDAEAFDVSNSNAKIRAKFTVMAPNGTEILTVGDPQNITWTTVGTVANVKFDYSTDSGSTYPNSIVGSAPNTGTYSWTVPDAISTNVRVRVMSATDVDAFDASNANFKIRGKFTITAPNGGEQWKIAQAQSITWATTGTISNVKIYYSMNSGSTFPNVISANTANTNSYAWTVPDTPTANARIRVEDVNDATVVDDSNTNFSIQGFFTLTAPNGGEAWAVASSQNITWTWGGTIPNVKLSYSTNGGTTFTNTISAFAPNGSGSGGNFSYSWTIPDTISPAVRVRVEDPNDATVFDDSNANLKIVGHFTVTAPNGGERWITNEVRDITWNTDGTIPNVKIDYSYDNFVTTVPIVASTPNLGTYSWTVPDPGIQNVPKASKVRVTDVNDAAVFDNSNATFNVDYYNISWEIRDLLTNASLSALSVVEVKSSDPNFIQWSEAGISTNPPRVQKTPYGTWVATWSKTGYGDGAQVLVANQDQNILLYMETSAVHIWLADSEGSYDPVGDKYDVVAWLSRDGSITTGGVSAVYKIYDGSTLLYSLTDNAIDAAGFFNFQVARPTGFVAGKTYTTVCEITVGSGGVFKTPSSFEITTPATLQDVKNTINSNIDKPLSQINTELQTTLNAQTQTITTKLDSQTQLIQTTLDNFSNQIQSSIVSLESAADLSLSSAETLKDTALKFSWKAVVAPNPALSGTTIVLEAQGPKGLFPICSVYNNKNDQVIVNGLMTEDQANPGNYSYAFSAAAGDFEAGQAYTYIVTEDSTGGLVAGSGFVESISLTSVAGLAAAAPAAEKAAKEAVKAIKDLEASMAKGGDIQDTMKLLRKAVEDMQYSAQNTPERENKLMRERVAEITEQLKQLAGDQGLNFDQLFKKAIDESSSIQEIRSNTGSLNQAVELIGAVVEKRLGGVEEPIVDVQLEPAS